MTSFTQFPGDHSKDICDVVIGFDFGTSCTKVVIRTPHHYAERAFAVDFGDAGHPSSQYLLPSVLWIDRDERATLTRVKNAVLVRDIKYHVLQNEQVAPVDQNGDGRTFDSKLAAIAFLASALRVVRAWFISTQSTLYGDLTLSWQLNLGLPSADFADEAFCQKYREIAAAAWFLSVQPLEISLISAEHVLLSPESWDSLEDDDAAEIELIPEVAAEVIGYARSDMRRDGLHILVDVGATTFDVCSFILHNKGGEDRYELLTADVPQLGALLLYKQRVEGVRHAVESHVFGLWDQYDPVCPMPDELADYLPCDDAISVSIKDRNDQHKKHCGHALWKTIVDLKRTRYPKAPCWESTLPLFVSGGGSFIPFFQTVIDDLSPELQALYIGCDGIQQLSLSKPENLVGDIDDRTYHRMAVAWGLSYEKVNIGSVCRPGDIDDVAPPESYDHRREFISKDQV
jgi:hypothetical protein